MFRIKTKEGNLNVSLDHVFENIIRKSFLDLNTNNNIKNLDDFIEHLNKKISSNHLKMSNAQTYSIYFLAGYYYRLFLEKNDVQIIDKKEEK